METAKVYYIQKIKEDLTLRQRLNPQYSLRAYAKQLGMHSSTLSQVLRGKRPLPIKVSQNVVKQLKLGPREKTIFLESLYKTKTSLDDIKVSEDDDRFMLDESYFKAIAEWEHYAVITLFDVDDFKPTLQEITRRLGISLTRAEVVVDNLLSCGLLTKSEDGELQKSHPKLRTTEDIQSLALKESHLETLEMGKKKLEEISVELRDFSSMTIAMDMEKLTEVKTVIREFRQKMAALLRDGKKTEVVQLAIQFYPITNIKETSNKETLQ